MGQDYNPADEAKRLRDTIGNRLWRLNNLYKIRTKDRRFKRFSPFNDTQRIILPELFADPTRPLRDLRLLVLKYRQGGVSTLVDLMLLDDTMFHRNTITGIVADKHENLGHLWGIVEMGFNSMPERLRPRVDKANTTTMNFPDTKSKIMVSLGFKSTALHNIHVSEWAYANDESVAMTLAGAPSANVVGETTPNGAGNSFYDFYQDSKAGLNGYRRLFIPWWTQAEFRDDVPPGFVFKPNDDERRYGLDAGQVLFRRRMLKSLRRDFFKFYVEDEETCFQRAGAFFFDHAKILALHREAVAWERENPPFAEEDDWVAWEKPSRECRYAAGADVAEGIDSGDGDKDYSVLAILCATHRQTAFRYRARVGVDAFYRACDRWGREYNNALLAVERNNHGHAVILGLQENCRYPRLYTPVRDETIVVVKKNQSKSRPYSEQEKCKVGWDTNSRTKPMMLDQFRVALQGDFEDDSEHFEPEWRCLDQEMLKNEALNVEEHSGKIEAVGRGKHDDCVMAWAIAHQMYRLVRARDRGPSHGIWVANKLESA